jgi:hypothetical protein
MNQRYYFQCHLLFSSHPKSYDKFEKCQDVAESICQASKLHSDGVGDNSNLYKQRISHGANSTAANTAGQSAGSVCTKNNLVHVVLTTV